MKKLGAKISVPADHINHREMSVIKASVGGSDPYFLLLIC